MRRNRLIAAGFAAAVTLGLLAVAQPGNATSETTTSETTTSETTTSETTTSETTADSKIAADTDVRICGVQSRAPNKGGNEDRDGNAVSILNTSASVTVNLNGWTLLVEDNNGVATASHAFGNISLLPKQHFILHTTGHVFFPVDARALGAPFSGQDLKGANTDEIEQLYEITLTNATPTQIDVVSTANGVPVLTSATDKYNAFVRRDAHCTGDTNKPLAIMPAIWGTQLS